jgi:hypothetical protein
VSVATDGKHEVTPTERTVAHIRQVVEKARVYLDYGTLEGRLEEISVHGGYRFTIWEELTNYRIECSISPDRLEEAKALLGHRVGVSGRIRYRNHRPTTIHVEGIRRLRGVNELPQLEGIEPIDITGGLRSEEYVRRMRDGE